MVDIHPAPNLSFIVAVAQNHAIGKDNDLLWHLSDDLRRFKALTSGHAVVMGRNTWQSLPRRPLPGRRNIVLTHDPTFADGGAEVVHTLPQLLDAIRDDDEAFCIGGATLYRQLLPYAQRLYVTWVYHDFDADVYFPPIDDSIFYVAEQSERHTDPHTGLHYSYVTYQRRPQPHHLAATSPHHF